MTRDELKEILITTFLTGVDEKWLSKNAEKFCGSTGVGLCVLQA